MVGWGWWGATAVVGKNTSTARPAPFMLFKLPRKLPIMLVGNRVGSARNFSLLCLNNYAPKQLSPRCSLLESGSSLLESRSTNKGYPI